MSVTYRQPLWSNQNSSVHRDGVTATVAVGGLLLLMGGSSLLTSSAKVSSEASFDESSAAPPTVTATSALMATVNLQDDSNTVEDGSDDGGDDDSTTILNWSGTHSVHVPNHSYHEPETLQELENIVRKCHRNASKDECTIRPLGSALSPNGIGFSSQGVIKLDNLDEVLKIDEEEQTVTVQAGARVSQVIEALRPHGWTLPNLASIAEQQMGGFVQVGAHGTGATIGPVDEYVTSIKLVTPSRGTVTLSANQNADLFHLAKVGLGCLGVVAEITMKIIPAHDLVEHTFVMSRQEAKDRVNDLLKEHKHMRYMWIPYTDTVVCVTNDPDSEVSSEVPRSWMAEYKKSKRFAPLRDLLMELTKDTAEPMTKEAMKGMGFGELRDALLAAGDGPLDVEHVQRVNSAEAEFWRRSEGYQTKPSDQLLQFDCGGQQWVWEVCFPTGASLAKKNMNDMEFMGKLLARIEEDGIAAHSPIEQRWTASSSSLMSPAYGKNLEELHSWVGIIMYLPNADDETQRHQITERFTKQYCDLMRSVGEEYNIASHWAKLEQPSSVWKAIDLQLHLSQRYPVALFNQARDLLDPKRILSNPLMDTAFGKPPSKSK